MYTPLDRKLTNDRYWYLQHAIARLHRCVPLPTRNHTLEIPRMDGPPPFIAFTSKLPFKYTATTGEEPLRTEDIEKSKNAGMCVEVNRLRVGWKSFKRLSAYKSLTNVWASMI